MKIKECDEKPPFSGTSQASHRPEKLGRCYLTHTIPGFRINQLSDAGDDDAEKLQELR